MRRQAWCFMPSAMASSSLELSVACPTGGVAVGMRCYRLDYGKEWRCHPYSIRRMVILSTVR